MCDAAACFFRGRALPGNSPGLSLAALQLTFPRLAVSFYLCPAFVSSFQGYKSIRIEKPIAVLTLPLVCLLPFSQSVFVHSVKLIVKLSPDIRFPAHPRTLLQGSRAVAASISACQYGSSRSRRIRSRSVASSRSRACRFSLPWSCLCLRALRSRETLRHFRKSRDRKSTR